MEQLNRQQRRREELKRNKQARREARSAKSSVNSSQADLSVVVRDFDVRVPNELATRSQPGDEPAAVLGEPATAVPRAGELAASGYAGPPAGQDRSEPDPGEPAR